MSRELRDDPRQLGSDVWIALQFGGAPILLGGILDTPGLGQAAAKGDVRFFELAYLEAEIKRSYRCTWRS